MKSIYVKIGNRVQRELKRELARQRSFSTGKSPMNNTGALSNSLFNEISFAEVDTVRVKGLSYGKFLNDGYNTPFTSKPPRSRMTSKSYFGCGRKGRLMASRVEEATNPSSGL